MRRHDAPPAISSTIGASPSTSELTAFAPIASPVSTSTCTTTIVSPRGVRTSRTSMSRGPAPRRQSPGVSSSARARMRRARRADALDRGAGIRHVDELDLPDHGARIGLGDEAAARARHQRRVRRRGDHRRLLDHHRDHDGRGRSPGS